MLKHKKWFATFALISASLLAEPTPPAQSSGVGNFSNLSAIKMGVINTRRCLEESKIGKQERTSLEKMKSQMEAMLKDKEKAVYEIESKLRDEDYMDSLSEDAERELKHKKRVLIEEGMELKQQFSENLEIANMKIMQAIVDLIAKASEQVATEMTRQGQPIDLILTSEACTYFNDKLDLTNLIIQKMDLLSEAIQKDTSSSNP